MGVVSLLHAGQSVHITATNEPAVIWDSAPGPGNYWSHLLHERELVLIHVSNQAGAVEPVITIQEDWP